jgi:hypothetical protein
MFELILSTAYFPPIEYFGLIFAADKVFLEDSESYRKQSFRNRTQILSANGTLPLSIPICHHTPDCLIKEVRIDYKTPWQRNHWKSILAAYNNSPYFLYYQDFFMPFFQNKYTFLFDLNLEIMLLLMNLLKIDKQIHLTGDFIACYENAVDCRNIIHPKKSSLTDYRFKLKQPYYQVFETKFDFIPNLSILDLLFNEGVNACAILRNFCNFAPLPDRL